MKNYIWIISVVTLPVFIVALVRVAQHGRRLNHQTELLNKRLSDFKNTDHSDSLNRVVRGTPDLSAAVSARKRLIKDRAKAKTERQRRLVKRLEGLTRTERE
jgi:hypothetical protein